MAQTLSPEVRSFLEEPRMGVVATINPDGSAQQTVVWYELRGDEVMFNTKRGRIKDRNLRRDPRVSLLVEDEYRYVAIRGTARLVEEQAVAQEDIRRLAERYHGREIAERQMRDQFSKEERVSIYLPLERVAPHGFEG